MLTHPLGTGLRWQQQVLEAEVERTVHSLVSMLLDDYIAPCNPRGTRGELAQIGLFEHVRARRSGLDVLFANVGWAQVATLEQTTTDHFDEIFDINVRRTDAQLFGYSDQVTQGHTCQRMAKQPAGRTQLAGVRNAGEKPQRIPSPTTGATTAIQHSGSFTLRKHPANSVFTRVISTQPTATQFVLPWGVVELTAGRTRLNGVA